MECGDRIAGIVLGAAVGDALGFPVEFLRSLDDIRRRHGPAGVTGYVRWHEAGGRRFARYSDDTQMAEVVLRSLLWGAGVGADLDATMKDMAAGFVQWAAEPLGGHRAPGNACLAGCAALARGAAWAEAGGEDAGGCGSVMRAYPFGVVFARELARAEAWAVAHSKLTHRAPIALAACAAMARGTAAVLGGATAPAAVAEMIAAAERHDRTTADMMRDAAARAADGTPPETVLARYLGWAAHDAIAAATFVFARHPDDPRAALLEAVNSPGDSDSLGTLVGALVGGRGGLASLPADWVRDVERSDELLALAAATSASAERADPSP